MTTMDRNSNYMVSCYTDAKGNVEAVIGLYRERLIYDISNVAYVEGHVMPEDTQEAKHTVQDIVQDGNVDRVNRMMDLAVSQLKEILYPFTKTEITDHELDDRLNEQSMYGIVLSLPKDFSQTSLNLLARLCHEYVVDYVLADWMAIAHPDKAEIWALKADDMETQITSAMARRHGRTRRTLTPW